MERHAVLRTLRNGELPTDFVSRWPKEAAFVLWLMAEDPRLRPSAREILEFDLIRKPKEEAGGGSTTTATATTLNGSSPTRGASMATPTLASMSVGNGKSNGEALKSNGKSKDLLGLGLMNLEKSDNDGNACRAFSRFLCEGCHVQCQCPRNEEKSIATGATEETTTTPTATETHSARRSKSLASGSSPTHRKTTSKVQIGTDDTLPMVEQHLLTEQSEKVRRLEQSMAAMRAENKALLDRIEELEFEKEQNSWKSH